MSPSGQTQHLHSRKAFVLYSLVLLIVVVGLLTRYLFARNVLEFLEFR